MQENLTKFATRSWTRQTNSLTESAHPTDRSGSSVLPTRTAWRIPKLSGQRGLFQRYGSPSIRPGIRKHRWTPHRTVIPLNLAAKRKQAPPQMKMDNGSQIARELGGIGIFSTAHHNGKENSIGLQVWILITLCALNPGRSQNTRSSKITTNKHWSGPLTVLLTFYLPLLPQS